MWGTLDQRCLRDHGQVSSSCLPKFPGTKWWQTSKSGWVNLTLVTCKLLYLYMDQDYWTWIFFLRFPLLSKLCLSFICCFDSKFSLSIDWGTLLHSGKRTVLTVCFFLNSRHKVPIVMELIPSQSLRSRDWVWYFFYFITSCMILNKSPNHSL